MALGTCTLVARGLLLLKARIICQKFCQNLRNDHCWTNFDKTLTNSSSLLGAQENNFRDKFWTHLGWIAIECCKVSERSQL